MEIAVFWLAFSIIAAAIASSKGRSGLGFFLLSVILSPLIGILAACLARRRDRRRLPIEFRLLFAGVVLLVGLILLVDQPSMRTASDPAQTKQNQSARTADTELTMSERYPGPWREDLNIGISRALVANHIGECGEYKYRESRVNEGEYIVHCSPDGTHWIEYQVWSRTKEVVFHAQNELGEP